MILGLKFSNYYSFYEPVEISFEVGKKPSASFYDIALDDERRVNKVIAVVGANGSGKTHFLRPLAFLSWFVGSSFLKAKPDSQIPFKAHALHEDEPSEIELRFNLLNGVEYKYHVILLKNDVVLEALYKKTSQQYSYIFVRDVRMMVLIVLRKKTKTSLLKKVRRKKSKLIPRCYQRPVCMERVKFILL